MDGESLVNASSRALEVNESSERPKDGNEERGEKPENYVEGRTGPEKITEAVPPRTVDHEVGLVTHGGHEGCRPGIGDDR